MRFALLGLVCFCSISWSTSAWAELFRNEYISFEVPVGWEYQLEGTEWVFRPGAQESQEGVPAIIILTAKEVGASDSLVQYEAYLRNPRSVPSDTGAPQQSQVQSVQQQSIHTHQWIDALHLGSELPGYYTRYLATTKENLAVLVTFTAHQRHYSRYSPEFAKAVSSLRISAMAPQPSTAEGTLGGGTLGGSILNSGTVETYLGAEALPEEDEASGADGQLLVLLLLAVGIVGGYYVYSRK